MLLMTIFQQLGPDLPMKYIPPTNKNDFSYINNLFKSKQIMLI